MVHRPYLNVYLGQENPQTRFLNLQSPISARRSLRYYRGPQAFWAIALIPRQTHASSLTTALFNQTFHPRQYRPRRQHSRRLACSPQTDTASQGCETARSGAPRNRHRQYALLGQRDLIALLRQGRYLACLSETWWTRKVQWQSV